MSQLISKDPADRRRLIAAVVLPLLLFVSAPLVAQSSRYASQNTKKAKSNPAVRVSQDIERFRGRVEAALSENHANKANWGVLVADRDSGETLYALNAERFFTPASNTKLFTTAFALASLGPDYHFRTTLEANASLAADGKLAGDLVLVGRGDPDISNRKFPHAGKVEHDGPTDKILAELVDAAVARGLKEVDGDVVADDGYFPYDPYPAGWSVGDLFFTYGAPVNALAFNDNSVSIEISTGARVGDSAIVTLDPLAAVAGFSQQVTTGVAGTESDLAVVRQPGPNFLLLRGSIPLGHPPMKLDLAITDPSETSARSLRQLLESRGVRVTGSVRVLHSPPPQALKPGQSPALLPLGQDTLVSNGNIVLAEHISPPLIESVRVTNKISQNLHAELLLRTVAREKTGIGSTEIGLRLEQDFLKAAGVADGDVILSDGSGLSENNLVTPDSVVALLEYVKRQPWGADYLATLPIAGVDGTLEDRMKNTRAVGLVQAKTGGLEHVHALSGYATTAAGEYLVFSIFANNNPQKGRDALVALDAIVVAMVETLGSRDKKAK